MFFYHKVNMLDKIDRKILYELDLNSRQPVKNIAKKLKLSREVVNYRLKKMIDLKVIRNFTTSISVFKVGSFIVKTYISFIDMSILKEKEIINYLLKNLLEKSHHVQKQLSLYHR